MRLIRRLSDSIVSPVASAGTVSPTDTVRLLIVGLSAQVLAFAVMRIVWFVREPAVDGKFAQIQSVAWSAMPGASGIVIQWTLKTCLLFGFWFFVTAVLRKDALWRDRLTGTLVFVITWILMGQFDQHRTNAARDCLILALGSVCIVFALRTINRADTQAVLGAIAIAGAAPVAEAILRFGAGAVTNTVPASFSLIALSLGNADAAVLGRLRVFALWWALLLALNLQPRLQRPRWVVLTLTLGATIFWSLRQH